MCIQNDHNAYEYSIFFTCLRGYRENLIIKVMEIANVLNVDFVQFEFSLHNFFIKSGYVKNTATFATAPLELLTLFAVTL